MKRDISALLFAQQFVKLQYKTSFSHIDLSFDVARPMIVHAFHLTTAHLFVPFHKYFLTTFRESDQPFAAK